MAGKTYEFIVVGCMFISRYESLIPICNAASKLSQLAQQDLVSPPVSLRVDHRLLFFSSKLELQKMDRTRIFSLNAGRLLHSFRKVSSMIRPFLKNHSICDQSIMLVAKS